MPTERRNRIVAESAHEFASAGYEHASLNRIIERCGMSKSSLYYLFSSKAELYDFVVEEMVVRIAADIPHVAPAQFAGTEFWPRLEDHFTSLLAVALRHEDFLLLGRMFYSPAPETADSAVAGTLTAVRHWVEEVLRVGRRCGAVRVDLPVDLQAELVFRILQVFDEWTLAHYDQFPPAELRTLADAQFATIRRTLSP